MTSSSRPTDPRHSICVVCRDPDRRLDGRPPWDPGELVIVLAAIELAGRLDLFRLPHCDYHAERARLAYVEKRFAASHHVVAIVELDLGDLPELARLDREFKP